MIIECPKCGARNRTDKSLQRGYEYRCCECKQPISWYVRSLAEGQTFRCASCGRIKRVKYVPTSNLCRSCAAKKAAEKRSVSNTLVALTSTVKKTTDKECIVAKIPKAENVPVSIADSLVVTTVVQKRLRKRAEREIPRPKAEKTAHNIEVYFWGLLALLFYPVVLSLNWLGWFGLSLYVGTPILVHLVIKAILAKPRRERQEQVVLRTHELAEERRKRIEEEQLFYSSPEWAKLRGLVIKEEGRVCAHCHRHIKNDSDVTVDHIRPRSKYPDLALRRENLRVLCRKCNSVKKDKELVDSLSL